MDGHCYLGSGDMKNKILLVIFLLLTLFGNLPISHIPWKASEKPSNLSELVKDADLVFVGELTYRDPHWYPCAGAIVLTQAKMKFRVIECLKGEYHEKSITVWQTMICNVYYIEDNRQSGKGLRLSPEQLPKQEKYLVMCKRLDSEYTHGPHYYLFDPQGIFLMTDEKRELMKNLF